jgi:hypothetical protein
MWRACACVEGCGRQLCGLRCRQAGCHTVQPHLRSAHMCTRTNTRTCTTSPPPLPHTHTRTCRSPLGG